MRQAGIIHYAKLKNSQRLQRGLAALKRAGKRGLTTREWQTRADICNPHTDSAELKANGIRITCTPEGRSPTGANVYRYRLV